MKEFRSTVIFMLLAFVALGYLLSDNFNTREKLTLVEQNNQKLLEENAALQTNNEALTQSLAESEQKVHDLTQINLTQQERINVLAEENSSLKAVVSSPQCQAENTSLLENLSNTPLAWVILLPIIPATFAASYGFIYFTRNTYKRSDKKGRRTEYIQLTGEEIEKVIQMRRRK